MRIIGMTIRITAGSMLFALAVYAILAAPALLSDANNTVISAQASPR